MNRASMGQYHLPIVLNQGCRPALKAGTGRTGGFSQPHLDEVQLIAKVLCAPQQSNSQNQRHHGKPPWFLDVSVVAFLSRISCLKPCTPYELNLFAGDTLTSSARPWSLSPCAPAVLVSDGLRETQERTLICTCPVHGS